MRRTKARGAPYAPPDFALAVPLRHDGKTVDCRFGTRCQCRSGGGRLSRTHDHPGRSLAPGGSTDTIARIVAEQMAKTLGQSIVIENDAGAGGTTPTTRVARAVPDGYTIMIGHMGTHGAAPAQYPNLKYHPAKDFTPIGLTAGLPIVIVTRKDFPANNLTEFVKYVRNNQGKVNEAHAGAG